MQGVNGNRFIIMHTMVSHNELDFNRKLLFSSLPKKLLKYFVCLTLREFGKKKLFELFIYLFKSESREVETSAETSNFGAP